MLHLQTLGSLDLRDATGEPLDAVLRQPKRLALLAYLAVSSPRRFHRRDTLLALFWPEFDEEHARASLRRALYFLRSALGAETVAGRGDDEVGVPEAALWCDATAMERLAAEGDDEAALALYRGPLLDGLYVAGASVEFQDWLDRERLRLRGAAAAAAGALVARAEAGGRPDAAAAWARRALELAPDDEAALRRYLAVLDRTGERLLALRAYDEFARRLAQDDLEPSTETLAVADGLRAHTAAAATSASTIAVLPFSVRGDPRFAYLREGLVELLATKLDGAGDIRTVDPRALLQAAAGDGGDGRELSPDEAAALARRFGAGRWLLGGVVEGGGRLQVTAALWDGDKTPVARVQAVADGERELFELVDELALQLLAAHGVAPGTRLTRIAALTTDSLDALKAYLQGERELRAGRYFDAMECFQTAMDADESFALAYYRLAAAAAGCALPDLARETADRGAPHHDRLSPHDRLVFAAQRAWLHGKVEQAESLYTTITGSYPDDVEAWFHLGDLLFHSNPLRGRSAAEARQPFERVLRLDPGHVGAMVHLVRISAIEGHTEAMLDLAARVVRASPESDQALAMRALRAYTARDADAIARVNVELQQARALSVAIAFADVACYSGNLEGARLLARTFLEVARSAEVQTLCHIQLAHLALALGDLAGTRAELAAAESLDRTWGLEIRALFAALPFLAVPEQELREVRDALAGWTQADSAPSGFLIFAMHHDLHPAIRTYLRGLLDLRLGDTASAADRLEELAELEATGPLVRNLTVELDAALAWARGNPADALARLERARPELWYQLTLGSPFFTLASQRFLRARLLEALGRTKEAAGWYRSIAERSPYEVIYLKAGREAVTRSGGQAVDGA